MNPTREKPLNTNIETFEVVKKGFLTTFQDQGRFGYQQYGLAPSGAMDEISYRWGNALLGNAANACSLEITMGNFELTTLKQTQIVVTGADLAFQINGRKAPRYEVLTIDKKTTLSWHLPNSGVRAYLSVLGGFSSELHWNSQSTNLREKIGVSLEEGQILHSHPQLNTSAQKYFPQSELRDFRAPLTIRFMPSDQYQDFATEEMNLFINQTFAVSTDFDRTGCRLEAAYPIQTPYQQMISEGIATGSIQIPQDGHPIIMMKDHPTIGGYPKVGTVFSLDLAYLAQCMPHQQVEFKPISLQRAQALRKQFEFRLNR